MSSMSVVVVTIGRNYGSVAGIDAGRPMPGWRWLEFKRAVLGTVSALGHVIQSPKLDEESAQHGIWDGSVEDAASFIVLDTHPERAASVTEALGHLAARYRQDAIGYIIGESVLVEHAKQ